MARRDFHRAVAAVGRKECANCPNDIWECELVEGGSAPALHVLRALGQLQRQQPKEPRCNRSIPKWTPPTQGDAHDRARAVQVGQRFTFLRCGHRGNQDLADPVLAPWQCLFGWESNEQANPICAAVLQQRDVQRRQRTTPWARQAVSGSALIFGAPPVTPVDENRDLRAVLMPAVAAAPLKMRIDTQERERVDDRTDKSARAKRIRRRAGHTGVLQDRRPSGSRCGAAGADEPVEATSDLSGRGHVGWWLCWRRILGLPSTRNGL